MNELSLVLYRTLYLCRKSEELIIELYPGNEMRTPMHMSMGQEAIAVGVCAGLGPDSQVLASYRSHAAFLAKTGDSDLFFAELFGRIGGTAAGKGGSMHLTDPKKGFLGSSGIVGAGIPVALGAAFANRMMSSQTVVAVFFGDGAVDEGVFWESLNVACLMKIPVVFVCEDNGLAVHTATSKRHGFVSLGEIVKGFDCIFEERDTTDVEEIHRITAAVIEQMKREKRPVFFCLKCYRYLEHVGIATDFHEGYRDKADFEKWNARDPLAMQRRRLLESGASESELRKTEKEIEERLQLSIKKARAGSLPGRNELLRGIFHEED